MNGMGCLNHKNYNRYPPPIPTTSTLRSQIANIGCGGILMTCIPCRRCWIALYMYKEDLLWVWMEWGAWIIGTNRYPPPIPTTSTLRSQIANIRCGGILMTCSHCRRCWIALYMYKEDLLWVWMEWGAWIIRTNRYTPPIPTTSTLRSQSQIANIRVWQHTYDL